MYGNAVTGADWQSSLASPAINKPTRRIDHSADVLKSGNTVVATSPIREENEHEESFPERSNVHDDSIMYDAISTTPLQRAVRRSISVAIKQGESLKATEQRGKSKEHSAKSIDSSTALQTGEHASSVTDLSAGGNGSNKACT
jgi:hypothetical protein